MKRPLGLVFDLDGTLLDTLASLADAFNQALQVRGHAPHPVEDYRQIIGDGARTAVCRALPSNSQNDQEIEQCLSLFREAYDQSWQEATVYAGIPDLLDRLAPDLPLAVLSNKDDIFTRQCVDYFFPNRFRLAIGASASIRHKPDPSGAVLIAEQLDVEVDQLWMIGDTPADMQTARESGMKGIAVLWGFRDRDELANHGANHIIVAPEDLLQLLAH